MLAGREKGEETDGEVSSCARLVTKRAVRKRVVFVVRYASD